VERIDGRFLDSLNRKFEFRSKTYKVKITPARIEDKKGNDREHYPGLREELVEDALRKLACDGQGVYLDELAGVIFSLNQLQAELCRMGHTYSKKELKDAILILSGTNMTLESADGQALFNSTLFESIGLQTREDWEGSGDKTKCFVRFNTLVTQSIKTRTFRMANYKRLMGHKHNLARWLEKRMSHLFIQADWTNTYDILLSTMVRDSGMKAYKRLRGNLEKIREGLEELKRKGVLAGYREEKKFDGKKMIEVKFIVKPGICFIRDIKKTNAVYKQLRRSQNNGLNGRFGWRRGKK
jgi:hypothetical protein